MRVRLLLAVAALASGCRTIDFQADPFAATPRGPSRTYYAIDWWRPLVDPIFLEVGPREFATPALDAEGGRVVVLTRDGQVRSLTAEGQQEWSFKTAARFFAAATVHQGVVYVPGGDAVLYALDAKTGQEQWRYQAPDALMTAPVVSGEQLLVQTRNETLIAVERGTGKWRWQYRRDVPSGFTITGAAQPLVSFGTAYVGFADGALVSLKADDGTVNWQRTLSSEAKQFLDVDSGPVLDDAGRLYVASYKDGVFGLDPETGSTLWHAKLAGVNGLVAQGEVLFASGDNQLAALHRENGRLLWSYPLRGRAAGKPAFAGGRLIAPVDDAMLFLDPATGRPLVEWDPGQGVTATPVAVGSRLYVLSNNGYLYAMTILGRSG